MNLYDFPLSVYFFYHTTISNVINFSCFPSDVEGCLLYTSDAADEEDSVDLGGRRIIKKKKKKIKKKRMNT